MIRKYSQDTLVLFACLIFISFQSVAFAKTYLHAEKMRRYFYHKNQSWSHFPLHLDARANLEDSAHENVIVFHILKYLRLSQLPEA